MQHLLPMHDDNGSEAATQLSLNWLFQSLNPGQITWQQKRLRLSVGVPRSASGLSRECDGCDFGPPGKPLQPLKRLCSRLSFDQGEHYASHHCALRNRWMKVYPKCARQLVFIATAACVLETSLFLICAFLSTCEFLTCRALSVPDLFYFQ